MVELFFGTLTPLDIAMALMTGFLAGLVLAAAYVMASHGVAHWKARKLVHIVMGTTIALTVVVYTNLSGPTFAAGVFLAILIYAWGHKHSLISDLLAAGSRENESRANTFVSGLMGMISFAVSFLLFLAQPAIFVSAILAVAWADAAGEVFGRLFGARVLSRRIRGKSVEGSVGVFVFSLLSLLVSLYLFADIQIVSVFPHLLTIAGLVTVTELVSTRWLDNFLIPLVTSFSMWLLLFPDMQLLFLPGL